MAVGLPVEQAERKRQAFDPVERAAHYNTGQIEVIDFIEDQKLGFYTGNVVKYICRTQCAHGNDYQLPALASIDPARALEMMFRDLQSLRKAAWYLGRYIALKESQFKPLLEEQEHRKDVLNS